MTEENQPINKNSGSIYTPPDFSKLLAEWAITSPAQKILDIGVGEGSIAFAGYHRLLALGASPEKAQRQIFGSEIESLAFSRFQGISKDQNINFPYIYHKDFFLSNFPVMDAVIGNPPYVRRSKIQNFETIRNSFLNDKGLVRDFPALTDLYVYFILRAGQSLKEGGRLAVITSDSWLTARYGEVLKNYLRDNFEIENLISLDRNIFHADVKALITLAVKKSAKSNLITHFAKIKNGLPANEILNVLKNPEISKPNVEIKAINLSTLDASHGWGAIFKEPDFYEKIINHQKITNIRNIAETRIGIQTLAKDFFVLKPQTVIDLCIEKEFVKPLIHSNRNYSSPVIKKKSTPYHYLFYCSLSKEEIRKTNAYQYIEVGEKAEVPVRGKNEVVTGYQSKERIIASRRNPWYNLKSELESREKAKILIPRVVAKYFKVYWNQAGYIPGEFFIEFYPKKPDIPTEVYLSILSSSLFDLCLRIKSHLYGGGAYSVYPGQFKEIPIINPVLFTEEEKLNLVTGYRKYLLDEEAGRKEIDLQVCKILGWNPDFNNQITQKLEDLITAVDRFKVAHAESGHQKNNE